MAVTAQLVKELRERTGAGMMDCKEALVETDGDIEKAIEYLREKGLAKAAKKAGRIAAEGLVRVSFDDKHQEAAIIEVNSETDFVAKNDEFVGFVEKLADIALAAGSDDIEAFKALPYEGKETIGDALNSLIAVSYTHLAVCLASAIGIAFAANLITFFIFYEMLTIATYPLVVHYRNDKAKASGRKYLAYTLISGQIFFAAIVWVYAEYGTLDFKAGGFIEPGSMSAGLMCILFFMMILGGAVKAGVMPLHGWLPSAMVAPTPVSALLHAVAVVKAGAFCVLRVVLYVFGPESASWCSGAYILSWFALATVLLSSLIAVRQDNLKARLAFSTVGQLSYIVLGISLLSPYSVTGAIFHIAAHAFLKITLFMAAGAIFVNLGLSEISQMGGIYKKMPVTSVCFAAASLGLAGLPLMVGFVSKFNILEGALTVGRPFAMAVLIAAALLALTYLMPVVSMFFKQTKEQQVKPETLEEHQDGHSHTVEKLSLIHI